MMTRREAIEALEYLISGKCTDTQMDYVDEIQIAITDMKICDANNAEQKQAAQWIHCNGKSHVWYCSNCGEKISYNNARKVYTKGMKQVEEVNRFCRGCGAKMIRAVEET